MDCIGHHCGQYRFKCGIGNFSIERGYFFRLYNQCCDICLRPNHNRESSLPTTHGQLLTDRQSYLNEVFSSLADERALILGIAQAVGAAFNAWVPLFIYNTGTQGPLFKVGFTTAAACAGGQAIGILLLWKFGNDVKK